MAERGGLISVTRKQLPLKIENTLRQVIRQCLLADRVVKRARSWMATSVMYLCMYLGCIYVCICDVSMYVPVMYLCMYL